MIALPFAGLLGLLGFPVAVWHQEISDVLSSFHWSFTYFASELSPWLLIRIANLLPLSRKPPAKMILPLE